MTSHFLIYRDAIGKIGIEMKACLIAFHRLHGAHDGESIARTVMHLLKRVGVDPAAVYYNIYQLI